MSTFTLESDRSLQATKTAVDSILQHAHHALTLYAHGDLRRNWFAVTDVKGNLLGADHLSAHDGSRRLQRVDADLSACFGAVDVADAARRAARQPCLVANVYTSTSFLTDSLDAFGTSRDHAGFGGRYRRIAERALDRHIAVRFLHSVPAANLACRPALSGSRAQADCAAKAPLEPYQFTRPDARPLPVPVPRALTAISFPSAEPLAYHSPWADGIPDAAAAAEAVRDLCLHANAFTAVEFTPKLAAGLLQFASYSAQRKLDEGRVRDHIDSMLHQRWQPSVSAIHFSFLPDGTPVVLNGQHRLNGCARIQRSFCSRVECGFARDATELAVRYSLFDMDGATRSPAEAMHGIGVTNATGFKTTFVTQALHALRVYYAEIGRKGKLGRSELMRRIPEWRAVLDAFRVAVSGGDPAVYSRLSASRPLAVLLALLRRYPGPAMRFIEDLTHPDRDDADESAVEAARTLRGITRASRKTGTLIANAWNRTQDPIADPTAWPPRLTHPAYQGKR